MIVYYSILVSIDEPEAAIRTKSRMIIPVASRCSAACLSLDLAGFDRSNLGSRIRSP